jgi:hypothetical protein
VSTEPRHRLFEILQSLLEQRTWLRTVTLIATAELLILGACAAGWMAATTEHCKYVNDDACGPGLSLSSATAVDLVALVLTLVLCISTISASATLLLSLLRSNITLAYCERDLRDACVVLSRQVQDQPATML